MAGDQQGKAPRPVRLAAYAVGDGIKHLRDVVTRHQDEAAGTPLGDALAGIHARLTELEASVHSDLRDLWHTEARNGRS